MPELPEVETVRRVMERALKGKRIAEVDARTDSIVYENRPPEAVVSALVGRVVNGAGRKGKIAWLRLDDDSSIFIHLGMSGWIRHLEANSEKRLLNHGKAPLDDDAGAPRFLKLMITAEDGSRVALTDGRRLARVWLGGDPAEDRRVKGLGPDAWTELPDSKTLLAMLKGRKAPIKAWLLDQSRLSGIGNWVADEVLYRARIAPNREAGSVTAKSVEKLCEAIQHVLDLAVDVEADSAQFPPDWMFHVRWGGNRGAPELLGKKIVRESVGGRTTAWIPELQR